MKLSKSTYQGSTHMIQDEEGKTLKIGSYRDCREYLRKAMVQALIDTVERTTELENVYNDKTGHCFSWEDLKKEFC